MGRVSAGLPFLATAGNAALGAGAVAYTLLGNKLFAVALIVAGVSLDGLDGMLARRAGVADSRAGRVADSVADAVTFGAAPAALVAVHQFNAPLWSPYLAFALVVAIVLLLLALARLAYFTLRAFHHPFFLGIPTPVMALSVVVLVLLFDEPPLVATLPVAFLGAALLAAVAMVVPIRYPKVRRSSSLRLPMTVTAVGLVAAVVSLQWGPAPPSVLWYLALAGTLIGAAGLLTYYVYGPLSIDRDRRRAEAVAHG